MLFDQSKGQSIETLRVEINQLLVGKDTIVRVVTLGGNERDILSINGDKRLPI